MGKLWGIILQMSQNSIVNNFLCVKLNWYERRSIKHFQLIQLNVQRTSNIIIIIIIIIHTFSRKGAI